MTLENVLRGFSMVGVHLKNPDLPRDSEKGGSPSEEYRRRVIAARSPSAEDFPIGMDGRESGLGYLCDMAETATALGCVLFVAYSVISGAVTGEAQINRDAGIQMARGVERLTGLDLSGEWAQAAFGMTGLLGQFMLFPGKRAGAFVHDMASAAYDGISGDPPERERQPDYAVKPPVPRPSP